MIYGYCRISKKSQNIERQVRNILSIHPDAIIVKEAFTGTKFQGRKEYENKILKKIKPGDTIVFDSVSRMSRNADEGCIEYEKLYNDGIILEFLKEHHIDTEVYRQTLQRQINLTLNTGNAATDKFMTAIIEALNTLTMDLAKEQIRLAFEQAEKEVTDLQIRTKEGIETARRSGKRIGQQKGATLIIKKKAPIQKEIMKKSKYFNGNLTDTDLIRVLEISRNTFYKYKRELLDDLV